MSVAHRVADWLVRRRASFPRWMNRIIDAPARNPDGMIGRLAFRVLGGSASNSDVPESATRVYIGPTNYSGQGYRWARALERADPSITARNMAVELPGGFAFPADTLVPIAVNSGNAEWQQREWDAARQFTHVLFEAERPIFGGRFRRSVADEARALGDQGVSVAFLAHGTDVRDPRAHAELTPWSPYPDDPRTTELQADAETNRRLLAELGRPVFVSTPDLLFDLPGATWCPVVIDVDRFATASPLFAGGPISVVHASSSAVQKGSHFIEPALRPVIERGAASWSLITGVAADEMPARLAASDIVIDQFRLGSYGVAACEAMAAGRVVIGHVLPSVREHVRSASGRDLPIVEATPDSLADVVEDLVNDPVRAGKIGAAGVEFVREVHDGRTSARVLIDHWIRATGSAST